MPIRSEPPPNPPPVGVARVRWTGSLAGGGWGSGIWLELTGDAAAGDLATLATDLYGIWETRLLPHQSSALHLLLCELRYFDGFDEPTASSAADHSGGLGGADLPPSCAACISWSIAASYRGGKPRTYLAGLTTSALTSPRELSGGYTGPLQVSAASFLDDINALSAGGITAVEAGTVAFFRAGAALAPPRFEPYTAVRVQPRVCSQRRRLGPELP